MDAVSFSNPRPAERAATGSAWRRLICYRTAEPIAITIDILVIAAACVVWRVVCTSSEGRIGLPSLLGMAPVVCALFVPAAKLKNLYHPSTFLSGNLQVWNVTVLWLGVISLLGVAAFALDLRTLFSPQAVAALVLIGLLGLLGHRAVWRLFIDKALANGSLPGRKIVLIHQARASRYPSGIPDLGRYGLQVERSLPFGSPGDSASLVRQRVEEAIACSLGSDVEELVIAADLQHWRQLKPHLARLRQLPLPVSLIPYGDLPAELIKQPHHILGPAILVEIQRAPLGLAERLTKRTLDLICAATGLFVLSPLLLLVTLLIRLESRGPALFRQTRLGFNGKPFRIYKFRTMTVLEDSDVKQATRDDERFTRVGRWLRRLSIDELPQLFNVLVGDMSIVGPRPHAVSHDDRYGQLIADYAFRRHMKPGMTGWAQVNGYRGATPKVDLMDRRLRLDLRYIENWSIWFDIYIIARTPIEIVRGENAY